MAVERRVAFTSHILVAINILLITSMTISNYFDNPSCADGPYWLAVTMEVHIVAMGRAERNFI
jgi:hypothetical protein